MFEFGPPRVTYTRRPPSTLAFRSARFVPAQFLGVLLCARLAREFTKRCNRTPDNTRLFLERQSKLFEKLCLRQKRGVCER